MSTKRPRSPNAEGSEQQKKQKENQPYWLPGQDFNCKLDVVYENDRVKLEPKFSEIKSFQLLCDYIKTHQRVNLRDRGHLRVPRHIFSVRLVQGGERVFYLLQSVDGTFVETNEPYDDWADGVKRDGCKGEVAVRVSIQ